MSEDNQHSHVFLVDIGSLGEFKFKPGVNKIGKLLAHTLNLAALSSESLVKSVGVVTSTQVRSMVLTTSSEVQHYRTKS